MPVVALERLTDGAAPHLDGHERPVGVAALPHEPEVGLAAGVLVDEPGHAVVLCVGLVENLAHGGCGVDEVAVRLEAVAVKLFGTSCDGGVAGLVAAHLALPFQLDKERCGVCGVPVLHAAPHPLLHVEGIRPQLHVVGAGAAALGGEVEQGEGVLACSARLESDAAPLH